MILFRILFGIDLIAAAVVVYFFVIGLADGSVSSFNGLLWAGMLGGVGAILFGDWALQANGRVRRANVVLLMLALPATLMALFFLLILVTNPRWN